MAGKLITFPLRVSLASARVLTRAAGEAAGYALSLAGRTVALVAPGRSQVVHQSADFTPAAPPPRPEPASPSPPRIPDVPRAPLTPEPPETPAMREPVHVSEEPELVGEAAEPGAEDGAGAAIRVIEPWRGYARMNARDVIARARNATRAELAAVRLYEARHRGRQTVLAAVDRQLKLAGGPQPA
jgi:hypothetical protein